MADNNKSIRNRERHLRRSYRRKMVLVFIIALIIGLVAGMICGVMYQKKKQPADVTVPVEVTPTPEPTESTVIEEPVDGETETTDEDDFFFTIPEEGEAEATVEPEETDEFGVEDLEGEASGEYEAGDGFEEEAGESTEVIEPEETVTEEAGETTEVIEPEETATEEAGETTEVIEPEATEETTETEGEETAEEGEGNTEDDIWGSDDWFEAEGEEVTEETAETEGETATEGEEVTEETAEEEPAEEIVEEEPENTVESTYLTEPCSFTVRVGADGTAYTGSGDYFDVPVTVSVLRTMDTAYYTEKYEEFYQLKGDEAGIEMQITLGECEGLEGVSIQDTLLTQLEDEDGNIIAGYKFKDAEIGGNNDSTIVPGETKLLYKRYSTAVEKQPVYLTIDCNGEMPQKFYFNFEEKPYVPEPVTYKKGDKDDAIKPLQEALITLGYLSGTADGDFGAKTESAVKAFQAANGLEETGAIDETLAAQLVEAAGTAPAEETEEDTDTLKKGDNNDEVKKLQSALISLHYLQGYPDGSYGAYTEDAVKRAQAALGFEATGKADLAFREALYQKAGM